MGYIVSLPAKRGPVRRQAGGEWRVVSGAWCVRLTALAPVLHWILPVEIRSRKMYVVTNSPLTTHAEGFAWKQFTVLCANADHPRQTVLENLNL